MVKCSTYIQESKICKNCKRNIGFYSAQQKEWFSYKLNLETNHCDGYIKKDL